MLEGENSVSVLRLSMNQRDDASLPENVSLRAMITVSMQMFMHIFRIFSNEVAFMHMAVSCVEEACDFGVQLQAREGGPNRSSFDILQCLY